MGVRGLTTFINSNSDLFFVKFKLHDCILIIDGNSLASILYSEKLGSSSAFGGDYDLLADHLQKFVCNLKTCKVEPIFIFDGGYEEKKATTVRKRNAMKVFVIEKVTPDRSSRDFFPYMLRRVVKEKLLELGVTTLQTDYEADKEIAAIAKRLNAPVLSNDSDFYIFDIPFIPFAGFSFEVCSYPSKGNAQYYIPCNIYYVEHFLKSFGGLEKNMLPLLATVLGNDYVNRSVFNNFYGLIKKEKGKKVTLGQRRVSAFVKWLRSENFDSALNKILSSIPKKQRQRVKCNINSIVNGYADLSTCLDKYLPEITNKNQNDLRYEKICSVQKNLNITDLTQSNCESNLHCSENDEDEEIGIAENSQLEDTESDEEEIEIAGQTSGPMMKDLPPWFLDRSRQCQIDPQVMTLLKLKTYFCVPQVEDCNLPHAGEIGLPILQVIGGLTLGSSTITYWYRHSSNAYRRKTIQINNTYKDSTLPCLSDLDKMSSEQRKLILLDTMNLENPRFLDIFPEDWQLLMICLVYWIKSQELLRSYNVHAIIMMLIAVNIHQSKVGIFRKKKLFVKKYGARVKSLEKLRENSTAKVNKTNDTVKNELSKITTDDCIITFESLLSFFDVDPMLKQRPRTFQRDIIHSFAELQTVLDLTQILNSLLLQPYKYIQIGKFYNGTFLYNITANFKRQRDIIGYLEKLYKKAPNLLNLHVSLYGELSQFCETIDRISETFSSKKTKKRRKKMYLSDNSTVTDSELSENTEHFHDKNNKFSLLQGAMKL